MRRRRSVADELFFRRFGGRRASALRYGAAVRSVTWGRFVVASYAVVVLLSGCGDSSTTAEAPSASSQETVTDPGSDSGAPTVPGELNCAATGTIESVIGEPLAVRHDIGVTCLLENDTGTVAVIGHQYTDKVSSEDFRDYARSFAEPYGMAPNYFAGRDVDTFYVTAPVADFRQSVLAELGADGTVREVTVNLSDRSLTPEKLMRIRGALWE